MHVLQNGILTATLLLVFFSRTENYWWCIFDAVCWFTYVLSGAHELRVLLISHVFHQDYFQTLTRLTEKTNNSLWCTGQPTQTIKSELKILSSTLQFAFSVIFFLLKRRTSVLFRLFRNVFIFLGGFDTSPGRNYKWLSIRYRNIPSKESSICTGLQLSFHERQTVRER